MEFNLIANANPSKDYLYFEAEHEENLNDYFLLVKVRGKNSYYRRDLPDFLLKANCTFKWVTGKGTSTEKGNSKNGVDYTVFQKKDKSFWNNIENESICLVRKADAQFVKCQ